jgi:hypothetical protein
VPLNGPTLHDQGLLAHPLPARASALQQGYGRESHASRTPLRLPSRLGCRYTSSYLATYAAATLMTEAAERGLPYPMQHKIGEPAPPGPPTRTAERHDWHLQSADPLSPWLEVVSADPHACSALIIVPAPTGLLAFRAWEGLWVCFGGVSEHRRRMWHSEGRTQLDEARAAWANPGARPQPVLDHGRLVRLRIRQWMLQPVDPSARPPIRQCELAAQQATCWKPPRNRRRKRGELTPY